MSINYITEFNGLDLELFLCTEILKLNSLHYGYWENNNDTTLAGVRAAQNRFTEKLIEVIPDNITNILDVGCGIGDVSKTLAHLDYDVTAISPDTNHAQYFNGPHSNLNFINTTFEDLSIAHKFDMVLMSESQNYFPTELGFRQCLSYLHPKGYLLVAGIFRKNANMEIKEVTNIFDEYIKTAEKYSLSLIDHLDFTPNVLPTVELVNRSMRNYIDPGIEMINHFVTSTSPVKSRLLKFMFQRQINTAARLYSYYYRRTNPQFFKQNLVYARLLFQRA